MQVLATCGVISEELISFASWARMWRSEGWHDLRRRVRSLALVSREESCVTLRATVELRAAGDCWPRWCSPPRATHRVTVSVLAHGEVVLASEARCRSELASLPRLGLHLQLPPSLDRAEWYGRGPHENYVDRCSGAPVGTHRLGADELFTPCLAPVTLCARGCNPM